ncbi:MAG: leucine-rich repeat domain-containing protein [Treponema sp.]|nr:leucine-rich repeat domain-containing protein [Treponema sp.]
MKHTQSVSQRLTAIIALVALMAFTMIACEGPMGPEGKPGAIGTNGIDGTPGTNGTNGTNGENGATPWICTDGFWHISGDPGTVFACNADCTGIKAAGTNGTNGEDGDTPYIGDCGNWHIGGTAAACDDACTGKKAAGTPGTVITYENCVLVFDGVPSAIPAHTFPDTWLPGRPANCTRVGLETRTCTGDGCTVTETRTVAALGHDWSDNWTLVTEPVITGEEVRTCQRTGCIATETRTAPPTEGLEFHWGIDSYVVRKGTVTAAIVIIPATFGGQPVTYIPHLGFSFYAAMTGIFIPASVTYIGGNAFNGCSALTSINVDATNPNYASVNGVLYNKTVTELIAAPQGISGSFTIPNSVTSIGDEAFYFCTGLTSITIPTSVTSISFRAFYSTGLTSITIPTSVESIDEDAFAYCTGLTSITIPASVTSIGEEAFYECTNLTLVTVERTATAGITMIDINVFEYTHDDLRIEVPAGSVAAYKADDNWSEWEDRIHAIGCTDANNPCGANCE